MATEEKLVHEIEQVPVSEAHRFCHTQEQYENQDNAKRGHEIMTDPIKFDISSCIPIEVWVVGGEVEDETVADGYKHRMWATEISRVVADSGILQIEVVLNGEL